MRGVLPSYSDRGPADPLAIAMRIGETGMKLKPGGNDKPRREWLRRELPSPGGLAPALQQFFATAPVACPYVPNRAERKLIVELGSGSAHFYDDLSRAGFRRSHRFAYRPACRACASCVPVRIAVDRFADTRSTRRVRNANRDLAAKLLASRATVEQFQLFSAYQRARHGDSEMASMSYGDYRAMVEDSPVRTRIAEFRDPADRLVAAALVDLLDDGVSAVYSYSTIRSSPGAASAPGAFCGWSRSAGGMPGPTSISATGSRTARRWPIRSALPRSSGSAPTAGPRLPAAPAAKAVLNFMSRSGS